MPFEKVLKLLFLAILCVYCPWTLLGILNYSEKMFPIFQLFTMVLLANPDLSGSLASIPEWLDDQHDTSQTHISDMLRDMLSLFSIALYVSVITYQPIKLIGALAFISLNQLFRSNEVPVKAFSIMDLCFMPACRFCQDYNPFPKLVHMGPRNA